MTRTRSEGALKGAPPARQRGLLRAIRVHPVARLGAVLALLTYVLIGLAPVWVPAVKQAGIEICTGDGVRIVPADSPLSGIPPDKPQPKGNCPLCTIQAAFLLPPADGPLQAVGDTASTFVRPDPARNSAGQFIGFDRLPRAPPSPLLS